MNARNICIGFLAIVVTLFILIYGFTPQIATWLVLRNAPDSIQIEQFEIESLDWNQGVINRVTGSAEGFELEIEQANIRYQVWPFDIHGSDIESVSIEWPTEKLNDTPYTRASDDPLSLIAPPFPINIYQLKIENTNPLESFSWSGSVFAQPGDHKGINIELTDKQTKLTLHNDKQNQHTLNLYDNENNVLLETSLKQENSSYQASGVVNAGSLADWAHKLDFIPAIYKKNLGSFEVSNHPIVFSGRYQPRSPLLLNLSGILQLSILEPEQYADIGTLHVEFNDYEIKQSEGSWHGKGAAKLELTSPTPWELYASNPSWVWSPQQFSFQANTLKALPYKLSAAQWFVNGHHRDEQITGDFGVEDLYSTDWNEELSGYTITADWLWDDSGLQAKGTANNSGLPSFQWQGQTKDDLSTLQINVKEPLAKSNQGLGVLLLGSYVNQLDIGNGDLSAEINVDWQEDLAPNILLKLNVTDADLKLDELSMESVVLNARSSANKSDTFAVELIIPSMTLATGVTATDTKILFEISDSELGIQVAQTNLLEGAARLRPVVLKLDDAKKTIFIDLESVSLENLVNFLELETTELTGTIAGPVRVVLGDEGIEINQAELNGTTPGILSIQLSQASSAVEQMDNLALQALSNFQYDELNAKILYQPDGSYHIKARIVGKNPEVLDGHPIALNPDIQGKLPSLFQAFILTGDFNREIVEQLQKERSMSSENETSTLNTE